MHSKCVTVSPAVILWWKGFFEHSYLQSHAACKVYMFVRQVKEMLVNMAILVDTNGPLDASWLQHVVAVVLQA